MPSIYVHLAHQAGDGEPEFLAHVFGAIMRLWMLDDITNVQARALFNASVQQEPEFSSWTLDASQEAQLDDIRAEYDSLNTNGKAAYFHKLESIAILLEEDLVTEADAKTVLGVT
jgi:hypothetical protein